MKKEYIFLLLLFVTLQYSVFGQLSKGAITLQGELGIGYQWAAEQGRQGLSLPFSPGFGIMVNNNIMIGGVVGGMVSSSDNINTEAWIQPFIRYYFNPASTKNLFFAGINAGIPTGDEPPFNASILGGINRFISPNLAIEGTLGYTYLEDQASLIAAGVGLRVFLSSEDQSAIKTAVGNLSSGSWMLGANRFSLSYFDNVFQINLSPNAGYFINDHLVVGGVLGSSLITGRNGNRTLSGISLQLQPFARYYLLQTGRWHWFGEVGGGINYSRTKQEELWESQSRNFFTHVRAGANLFLTSSVALEFALNATREFDANLQSEWNQDVIQIPQIDGRIDSRNIQLSLQVGLQFFL